MVKDPVVPSLITETQQADDDYSPYSPSTNVQPPVGLFGNDKIEWQTSSKPPLSRRLSIRPRSLPSAPKMPTKTLALFPIVARATIIKVYRDRSGRKILPESLLAHSKILRELNSLMGSEYSPYIRKTAVKRTHGILTRLIQHTYKLTPLACSIYQITLKELCDDSAPEALQRDGLQLLSRMVIGAASMGQKDVSIEIEDCRIAFEAFSQSSQVSLRLSSLWYIWLFTANFGNHSHKLFDADNARQFNSTLAEITRPAYPYLLREAALNLLWKFENLQPGLLSRAEQRSVWLNIMELTRTHSSKDTVFMGFRYLWWYSLFPVWAQGFKLAVPHKRKIGLDLYQFSLPANTNDIRRQAYELIYLLTNTETWKDMYDDRTRRTIVGEMVVFCRADSSRLNRPSILNQISNITVAKSTPSEAAAPLPLPLSEDRRISLREQIRSSEESFALSKHQPSTQGTVVDDTLYEEAEEVSDEQRDLERSDDEESVCSNEAIVNGPSSRRRRRRSYAVSHISGTTLVSSSVGNSRRVSSSAASSTVVSNNVTRRKASRRRHRPPTDLRPEKSAYSTLSSNTNLRMGGIEQPTLAPSTQSVDAPVSPVPTSPVRKPSFEPSPDVYALSEVFPYRLSDSKMYRDALERCDKTTDGVEGFEVALVQKGKAVDLDADVGASLRAGGTLSGMLENLDVFVLPGESVLDQKDARTIYCRLVDHIRYNENIAIRELAIQGLYVLSILMSWSSTMRLPEGPLEVSS